MLIFVDEAIRESRQLKKVNRLETENEELKTNRDELILKCLAILPITRSSGLKWRQISTGLSAGIDWRLKGPLFSHRLIKRESSIENSDLLSVEYFCAFKLPSAR